MLTSYYLLEFKSIKATLSTSFFFTPAVSSPLQNVLKLSKKPNIGKDVPLPCPLCPLIKRNIPFLHAQNWQPLYLRCAQGMTRWAAFNTPLFPPSSCPASGKESYVQEIITQDMSLPVSSFSFFVGVRPYGHRLFASVCAFDHLLSIGGQGGFPSLFFQFRDYGTLFHFSFDSFTIVLNVAS